MRYIVEQYFGLSHLHDGAYRVRFVTIAKNIFDYWSRQVYPVKSYSHLYWAAYNIKRGLKILSLATT